jgi:hypothetical protein
MDKYVKLMKTLPPLVAAVVWDVVNGRITDNTVKLANMTSEEDYQNYNVIRCVVTANPKYPPLDMALDLVDELIREEVK